MELSFIKYIQEGFRIGDIGCGPNGANWWDQVNGCIINAFDLYNQPDDFERGGNKIFFSMIDVSKPNNLSNYINSFDLIVADHIFEHVLDPYGLSMGCNRILKDGGLMHVGIPTGDNFTDKFYRLIHSDGGGHTVKYTRDNFIELMSLHGFELIEENKWPDDWSWFEKLYSSEDSLTRYGISSVTADDIKYMADVFRKELTVEKGYFYGYEFLFRKTNNIDCVVSEKRDFCTKVRESVFEKMSGVHDSLMEISDWASEINNRLTDREARIVEINDSLTARDAKIKEITDHLTARDAKINEITNHLTARDAKINEITGCFLYRVLRKLKLLK